MESDATRAGRLMVLAGGVDAEKLVRLGERTARPSGARWTVAHVSASGIADIAKEQRLERALELAESLGAEVVALTGYDLVAEILAYAAEHNITQIVVGRSRRRWRWIALRPSLAGALVRRARGVAVTVVADTSGSGAKVGRPWRKPAFAGYLAGVLATAIAAGLSWLLAHSLSTPNLSLVFVMGVLVVAVRYGRGAALVTALLSFLTFNFLFTKPLYTLRVASREDVFTIAFFLFVALLIGQLGGRLRRQMLVIRDNGRLNSLLYEFSKRLNAASGRAEIVTCLREHLAESIHTPAIVLLAGADGTLGTDADLMREELEAARWALEHDETAGRGTPQRPDGRWQFLPMRSATHPLGVVGLALDASGSALSPLHRRLVHALRDQAAVALEKERLSEEIARARLTVETERLRAALLSSVSHDLRTPLVSIIGAASSLLEMGPQLGAEASRELLTGLLGEAERLNRFVQNLLDMTRLGYGAIKPRLEWHDVREIIGEATRRLQTALAELRLDIRIPDEHLIYTDAALLGQVLVNLLDNAAKYAPRGSTLHVAAAVSPAHRLQLAIEDEGPGIPPEERERVFDMFYRVDKGDRQIAGTGLGLAICRDLVKVLGGGIRIGSGTGNRGARFELEFPQPAAPEVERR